MRFIIFIEICKAWFVILDRYDRIVEKIRKVRV